LVVLGCTGISALSFAKDFLFGAGTSAYQVEGAWNEDGKGPSLWDHITQTYPQVISDKKNGNVACDSYHKVQEDINLVKSMGLNFYRFSISWSRLLPDGTTGRINQAGINYYNKLINGLKAAGIEPFITLFNFDMPMALENKGGFTNAETIQHFVNYANLVFKTFGDRVKYWATFNEAHAFCKIIFVDILAKVQKVDVANVPYKCGHNVLLAHARVYRLYQSSYKPKQKGIIGMQFSSYNYVPNSNSEADKAAALRAREFVFGWFAHPIFQGNYPQVMIDQVARLSKAEGLRQSRLPAFTPAEINEIKGTHDYVGINPLFSFLTTDNSNQNLPANPQNDIRIIQATSPKWDHTSAYVSYPQGFRDTLNWVAKYTNNARMVISEHGLGNQNGGLQDNDRVNFFKTYLEQVLLAINTDKLPIFAYSVWQMMDTFYFNTGEVLKFGLANVDFNSPNRTRTLRQSANYYKKVITTRNL
jgi:beta-glucosidase/6-phospho-beta-glucosidase/beta-galactosidase